MIGIGLLNLRFAAGLMGLGSEIWQGVDAQDYVDSLRHEWDHRP
jgi:hypothetical protein